MKKLHLFVLPLLTAAAVPALAAPVHPTAPLTGAMAPGKVTFQIFMPLRNVAALNKLAADQQTQSSPNFQKWISPAQYASQFGPTSASRSAVTSAAKAGGFTIDSAGARSVSVTGTVAQINQFFQTTLKTVTMPNGKTTIIATTPLVMPTAFAAEGARVVSFARIPPRQPMARVASPSVSKLPDNRSSTHGAYWYNDMKQAYDYPSYDSFLPGGARLDGTGVRAAVLMEDQLYAGDVAAFFNHEKFTTTTGKPVPTVTTVLVNGGGTVGGDGTFEASLDVQQILGGAPGSNVTLVSIPNLSDNNILAGYTYIVSNNTYDVVNSSFGGCELGYTAAYNGGVDYTYILQTYDDLFKQGNMQGITFVASSGDNGGLECPSTSYYVDGQNGTFVKGVSAPADSAYVTAVGGGNLITNFTQGSLDSTYFGENGYGDPLIPYDVYGYGNGSKVSGGYWGAGGGVSVVFPAPAYQSTVNSGSTFRTIPDVGMQVGGCPGGISQTPCGPDRSAAVTAYNGGFYGVIGTSVSSPEFVGALALYIQKHGKRVGNFNPYLYHYGTAQTFAGGISAPAASQYYHRNIPGYDGYYADTYPTTNYNYINGNGTPDVRKLLGFTDFAPAGLPQTISNP